MSRVIVWFTRLQANHYIPSDRPLWLAGIGLIALIVLLVIFRPFPL
jgi:hypothetical protein